MQKLLFFRDVLAERFGQTLQRIPIDPGFSCPHRTLSGTGGCTFCAADGSRARHLSAGMTLEEQVERGKEYVRVRYGSNGPYIAYFQAFTGTNAPVDVIRGIYEKVLSLADFRLIAIGTRPDCLPEDCLEYLDELNRRIGVIVELGVQTANDTTLQRIHRGHDFACSADAVWRLHKHGIPVAAHLILGLPGETEKDWLYTAEQIARLPFTAVKIHQLLVLKGTKLAAEYAASPFPTLNEYEYADALEKVLRILPDSMSIMRLTAEAEEDGIIAPRWWMKKGQFLEMFTGKFEQAAQNRFVPCRTGDGSFTLYHPEYRQHFHSVAGAREESVRKYLIPSGLKEKLQTKSHVRLLDVGFGLGCNASAAFHLAEETASGQIEIISLELDHSVLDAALSLPEQPDSEMLQSLKQTGSFQGRYSSIRFIPGDARKNVPDGLFDVIFLDGFSSENNPELWTADFVKILADHLADDGVLTTYSSAYPLFGALMNAGLQVFRSEAFGRRRQGTAASKRALDYLEPLSEKDTAITQKSTAGVPLRDPTLDATREVIFETRAKEVALLRKRGIPKWYIAPKEQGNISR